MNDYPDDIDQLKALIDSGDKRAYLHLAFVYESQNDIGNANLYYQKGAEAGDKDAQFFYAYRLENGINTDIDVEIANKYYKLSADQGNCDAALRYSMNLSEGHGIENNDAEAERYLRIAKGLQKQAKEKLKDEIESQSISSNLDPTDINSLKQKAFEENDNEAMLLCGFYYDDPKDPVNHDPKKAQEFFKMSADAGNAKAQFMYGIILTYGVDRVKEDQEAGLEYIKKAAQNGNVDAQQYLEQLEKSNEEEKNKDGGKKENHHLNGFEGLPEDDINELERIVKEEENSFAMLRLGLIYDSLERFEEANQMLKLSSDKGNPNAQFIYGLRKEFGINTDIDLAEANNHYRKSAVQGNEDASYRLGLNLLHGNGIDKNEKEANMFLKMSAELGQRDAMMQLAANLKDGVGIESDPDLADQYMRRAMGLKV